MISGIMLWNEPNNLSHWDFEMDSDWRQFSRMVRLAARRIKSMRSNVPIVLGGISPIDPNFISLLDSYGTFEHLDAIGVHGFPLDWNHWTIDQWPAKVTEITSMTRLPVWVTEVGASSFGADEVQTFGLRRTAELLVGRVEQIYWYSLLDLPPAWPATTRHREAEGSSYYRHFYLGLIRADGTPKPALRYFDPAMGFCQWFHYQDHRLDFAVEWMNKLGVKKLRTGISWADWLRPGALEWFDRQMEALKDFETIVTLCFTPPSRGQRPCHTSPPIDLAEYADFAEQVIERYCPPTSLRIRTNETLTFSERRLHENDSDRDRRDGQLCQFAASGD